MFFKKIIIIIIILKTNLIGVLTTRDHVTIKDAKQPIKRKDILHIFIDGIPY